MSLAQPLTRSTADARRPLVVAHALAVFARTGYYATRVAEVAAAAGISEAYVYRLFDDKLGLFLAALDHCYVQIVAAMAAGADRARGAAPAEVLDAMAGAYAALIEDRDLVALQVHAQSAATVPDIGAAVRRGYETVLTFVQARSGADDAAVRRFMAYGQLGHLAATLDLDAVQAPWARVITGRVPRPSDLPTGRRA